jgi:Leu/Phe-tRNA-protein transferase
MAYPLRFLPSGHIFISSKDNCDRVVDAMLETEYDEEFCLANNFDEGFVCRLMEAGFLVMSAELWDGQSGAPSANGSSAERFFVLLPKLHLVRSVLFFDELHIKKSIRPFLSRYELRVSFGKTNSDFDTILEKCIETHGADWLTPLLVETLKNMREREDLPVKPVSFAVYRDGKLKAGEIGVVMGRVYTSYSGYYEEDNAGTVQMILTAKRLDEAGFDFLDFGMPLDYKTALGARDISPHEFVEIFRAAQK